MKIAYIILAHQYPEQLIRLICRLNTESTSFFVHFNKRSDDKIYYQIVNQLSSLSNVYFLKRHKCYWGHFSLVNAIVEGIKEILNTNIFFDYFILLSGQDYPIKPNSHIEKIIRENEGKEFISYFPLSKNKWKGKYEGSRRIEYWHFRFLSRELCFPEKRKFNSFIASLLWSYLILFFPIKRKFPKGFEPYGGSLWWCLSRACVEYINNFMSQNNAFINYFKYVYIPDELFFQTIILNSPFKDSVINDNLRYIVWPGPKTLGKKDFEEIISCSKLFARKFDTTKDPDILDMLDQKILNDV